MRFAIFICILILPLNALSQARRANSLIEKERLEDAYLLLNKAVDNDSLASAEKYVLAGLFFNSSFEKNDLDSAYHYILESINAYNLTETKGLETLNKRGFNLDVYNERKAKIEEAGFNRAVVRGQEQDFIEFLLKFNTSIHIDSAISLRNEVAFINAVHEDTYNAYQHFFSTYPQANQVPEARKRYERLLYDIKTADGKLKSYQDFLNNYPDTYHRHEAEKIIYNIITGEFSEQAFERFINQYPNSYLSNQAKIGRYTLLDKAKRTTFLIEGGLRSEQIDSITSLGIKLDQLLIPTIHDSRYQVINAKGQVLVENLMNISDEDKCQMSSLGLILASYDETNTILNLDGRVLLEGNIASMKEEGDGILKVNNGISDYFIHTGGFRTNENEFKNAVVAGPYIAFKNKYKWGLESLTGLAMLNEEYDSILSFHNYIILNKDNKWGLYPTDHFYPLLDRDKIILDYSYDQIVVLNNDYLLLQKDNNTALMGRNGHFLVPMADQSIELVDGGYFVDRGDSILDSRVANSWYYDLSENERWTIGDRGTVIDVFYQNQPLFIAQDAQIVGNTAMRVVLNDSTYCFFNDTTKIVLGENDLIIPIRRMGENSSTRHFIYTNSEKEQVVYDNTGSQIEVGKYNKLMDLGTSYMLRRNKGIFDLINNEGHEVLEDIDAAISLNNGYVSYLADGKFGLFNEKDSTNINPKYDRPLSAYSASLFIATSSNKFGLIDKNDSTLVPLRYNEIRYLNDTIAMLSRGLPVVILGY